MLKSNLQCLQYSRLVFLRKRLRKLTLILIRINLNGLKIVSHHDQCTLKIIRTFSLHNCPKQQLNCNGVK